MYIYFKKPIGCKDLTIFKHFPLWIAIHQIVFDLLNAFLMWSTVIIVIEIWFSLQLMREKPNKMRYWPSTQRFGNKSHDVFFCVWFFFLSIIGFRSCATTKYCSIVLWVNKTEPIWQLHVNFRNLFDNLWINFPNHL